jgi:hypothetical protein
MLCRIFHVPKEAFKLSQVKACPAHHNYKAMHLTPLLNKKKKGHIPPYLFALGSALLKKEKGKRKTFYLLSVQLF